MAQICDINNCENVATEHIVMINTSKPPIQRVYDVCIEHFEYIEQEHFGAPRRGGLLA